MRPRHITAASSLAVLALIANTLPTQAAAVSGNTACGADQRIVQESSGGIYVLSRPNPFNTTQRFCIQSGTKPGFRILNNLSYNGTVRAYPFTGVGCAYYLCSRNTDLPKRVSALPYAANTSWTWQGNSNGYWNASYDLWFDKRNQITSQDNGAELMIWLRTMPGYNGGQLIHVGKRRFIFMHWKACNAGTCWNYIQFRFLHTTHGVKQIWLRSFIKYAESRGLIQPSWFLTSVHTGFELWSGGKGLSTTWFNAHV